MATEQYCLRWNDHRTILLSNFERLLKNSTSVDCTLAAEGQCLRAHKVVLSACSPYFEIMLNQDKEKHPIIFMKDMKYKELQAILEYMYRGEVVIPHDQLAALLHAAESLQIKGLGCGDKQATDTGSLVSNPQLQQQQQQQQSMQKPMQSFRQSGPTSRISETPKVTHEVPPQIVDLTDDRMPGNPSIVRHMQESTKRSIPQAPARTKRPAFSLGTPERNNQKSNHTTLSPTNNQNNLVAPKVTQASGGNIFAILNAASISGGVAVASPAKQPFTVTSRQSSESGGHSEHQTPQVVTPPIQRTETQESGKQTVYKSKTRSVPARRYAQGNVPHSASGQSSSVASPPQNSDSAEKTTAVRNTHNVSEDRQLQLNATRPSQLPEVQQTNCTVDELQVNDSTLQDSFLEPVADQAKETDAEKLTSENQNGSTTTTNKEATPALNEPGPSGEASTAKPGRRGRPSERRYPCPECNRKFTQKGYLEKHLRIHDGDCYQCDVCDKTFLSRPTLIRHVRSHATKTSAATQHKCQLCGAAFSNASDLEKHLTDHTLSVADDKE